MLLQNIHHCVAGVKFLKLDHATPLLKILPFFFSFSLKAKVLFSMASKDICSLASYLYSLFLHIHTPYSSYSEQLADCALRIRPLHRIHICSSLARIALHFLSCHPYQYNP